MLYYLTGMATERSAVLAYNLLHDGVVRDGRDRHRQDGRSARSGARSRPLRLLPAVGARPVGRAGRLAAVDGPAHAPGLVRPGRRQQRRAEGRLRRRDDDPRHHRAASTTSPSRSPGSSASCSGPATAASRCRTTSPRPSARPSSWRRSGAQARVAGRTQVHAYRSTRSAIQAMSSAVAAGVSGGLHDVAEHHPHHHVDGGVELVRRRARRRTAPTRSATTALAARAATRRAWSAAAAARCRRRGWPRRPRAAAGCPARARAPPGRPPRIAATRSSGWSSKATRDHAEEPVELAQDHRLGQPRLGADLVVDRLPADPDRVGEPGHRHLRPADCRWSARRPRRRSARASSGAGCHDGHASHVDGSRCPSS